MIFKTYIFSQVSDVYQQYTTDSSALFLRDICKKCSASNQIAIHRDGNLMYYAYIHKSSNSEIYGMCIVCGEVCLNVKKLYEVFQQLLDSVACKGVLFRYDDKGNIRKNVETFSKEPAEVDNILRQLIETLNGQQSLWDTLPHRDLSIPLNSLIRLSFTEDGASKIVDAIRHYHNVIVTLETAIPSSFSVIVRSKSDEIEKLMEENQELKNENRKIKQQKKQFQTVVILFLVLIGCGIGIYFLFANLDDTQKRLNDAKKDIELKNQQIESLNNDIESLNNDNARLQSSLSDEKSKRERTERELSDLRMNMSSLPILITSVDVANTDYDGNIETDYGNRIYSNKTMYLGLRIKYTGLKSGESITLYIKLFKPDGTISKSNTSPSGYTKSTSITIKSGEGNIAYLGGWGNNNKGHWGKGTYRYEIWYGSMCLKEKTFTIY